MNYHRSCCRIHTYVGRTRNLNKYQILNVPDKILIILMCRCLTSCLLCLDFYYFCFRIPSQWITLTKIQFQSGIDWYCVDLFACQFVDWSEGYRRVKYGGQEFRCLKNSQVFFCCNWCLEKNLTIERQSGSGKLIQAQVHVTFRFL